MKRPGLKRKPSRAVERARAAAKVVSLVEPDLVLERTARRFLPHAIDRCVKCDSTFVGREPAFIHCYYCGKMARIANAPLHLQEEFEMRSGLRIAV